MFDTTKTDLAEILKHAHEGRLQLPDFQRSYVWGDGDVARPDRLDRAGLSRGRAPDAGDGWRRALQAAADRGGRPRRRGISRRCCSTGSNGSPRSIRRSTRPSRCGPRKDERDHGRASLLPRHARRARGGRGTWRRPSSGCPPTAWVRKNFGREGGARPLHAGERVGAGDVPARPDVRVPHLVSGLVRSQARQGRRGARCSTLSTTSRIGS